MELVEKVKLAVGAVLQLAGVVGLLSVNETLLQAVSAAVAAVGALVLLFVRPGAGS